LNQADDVVAQQQFEANAEKFFRTGEEGEIHRGAPSQSEEEANNIFYGVETNQPKGLQLGDPIPGYSGSNRRVEADNVFGMTYAEARRRDQESQNRIEVEKGETLKQTSQFVPAYKQTQGQGF